MKKLAAITTLILLSGCSHMERSAEVRAEVSAPEVQELHKAEDLLAEGRFAESKKAYRDFQNKYPQSKYFQAARLGEAESYEGRGEYQEAVDLNRGIYLSTLRYQPDIAAKALYRSAFSYEAMGDDLKATAALLDAKKLGEHLPPEVAYAEIPAKLSAIYARQDREDEALKYLNEAEKGLTYVLQQKGNTVDKSWLARAYYQMGSISTNQLTKDNFGAFTQGQMWVQSYLIKAMKLGDPVWSLRAQNKLIETYRDLYRTLESSEDDIRRQVEMGGDLFDLLDQADLYRPLAEQKPNSYEAPFFATLADIRTKSEKILYGAKETMGLTIESQKLNGLRRAGRVKADSLLPGEKKSSIPLPSKIVPSEDPNL